MAVFRGGIRVGGGGEFFRTGALIAFRRRVPPSRPIGTMLKPVFQRKCVRGFTLLEMLLVLTIAVVAMALVVPNFTKGLDSVRLQSASRELASAFRYLRGYAVAHNVESEFNLNVETNRYRLSGRNKVYSVPESIGLKLVTAETEITGANSGTIRFYPDGSSSGGRVTLRAGNRKRLVDINWLTGQVEIFREVGE